MKEVTQEQFYAALRADNRDIMPRIVGVWDEVRGYAQEWRANNYAGTLFGVTEGRPTFSSQRYFLVYSSLAA